MISSEEDRLTERPGKKKVKSKMADINPVIILTTLSMNGLNDQIKRQRLSRWVKKEKIGSKYNAVYRRYIDTKIQEG